MSEVVSPVKRIMETFARDAELDEFLEERLSDAGYGGCEVQRTPLGTRITIHVTRPGLVIGRRGQGIRELTEEVEKKFNFPNPQINVLEVEVPELNPRIMATRIAQLMARGTAFRRAAIWALNAIMNAGAMGAEIVISGKLRSERAHYEKYRAGVIPKSGYPKEVSVKEATKHLLLKMGLYGIKVKIALKDAIPPEFEIIELKEVEEDASTEGEGAKEAEG